MERFQIVDKLLRGEHHEQIEYGFFSINWKSHDGRLKKNFADWINQQRKELKKRGVTKKPSRGGLRDQLRSLGALRIKEHYPRKSLVNDPYPKLKVRARFPIFPTYTLPRNTRSKSSTGRFSALENWQSPVGVSSKTYLLLSLHRGSAIFLNANKVT